MERSGLLHAPHVPSRMTLAHGRDAARHAGEELVAAAERLPDWAVGAAHSARGELTEAARRHGRRHGRRHRRRHGMVRSRRGRCVSRSRLLWSSGAGLTAAMAAMWWWRRRRAERWQEWDAGSTVPATPAGRDGEPDELPVSP